MLLGDRNMESCPSDGKDRASVVYTTLILKAVLVLGWSDWKKEMGKICINADWQEGL
jgi:hypothetical protein